MKRTLKFVTWEGKLWYVTREFSDQRHLDNYAAYMKRNKRMTLDEVYETH
jgi:hypothetical protein